MALVKLKSDDRPALDERGVPRDGHRRPLIHVPDQCTICKGTARTATERRLVPYTRVTTFVDCIEDKSRINRRDRRMTLVGATRAPHLVEEARGLDPDDSRDRAHLDRIVEQALAASGADWRREKGSDLHELSEYVDQGMPLPDTLHRPGRQPVRVTEDDVADMAAYRLATVGMDMLHIERFVVCDELRAAGTADRIVRYSGPGPVVDGTAQHIDGTFIADLKTGSLEFGALKMAAQLAIYSRSQMYDPDTLTRSPLPDVRQDWGLIINLRPGSARADLYWIDMAIGWEIAQLARDIRDARRLASRVLQPVAVSADL